MRIYITKDGAVIADDEFKKRFPDAKADVVNGKLVLKNMYEICAGRGAYIGARLIGKGIYQRYDTRASIPSTFVVYNRSYEQTMSNNILSLLESRGWSSTVDFTKPYAVAYFYKYMPPLVTSVFKTVADGGHVEHRFPYTARVYELNGEGSYISNSAVFKGFNTEKEARKELSYISKHGLPDLGADISIDPGLDDVFGDVDSGRGSCLKTLVMYPHNIDAALSVIDKLTPVGKVIIVGFELMDYEQREKALSIIEQLENAVGYYKNFCKIYNRFGGIDIYVNENKYFHEVCTAFAPSLNRFSFRIYTDGYEYDVMHGDGHLNISVPDTLFEAMNYIWYAPDVADINGEQFYIYGAPTDDGDEIYFSKKKFQAAGVSAYIKVSDIESLASAWGLPVVTNADKKSILAYGFEDDVNAYIIEHFYDDTVELRMDGVSATSDYINVESKYTLTFLAFVNKSKLPIKFRGFTYNNGKVYGGYPELKEALKLLGGRVEYHLDSYIGFKYETANFPNIHGGTPWLLMHSRNVYYDFKNENRLLDVWELGGSTNWKNFVIAIVGLDVFSQAKEIALGNITEDDFNIVDHFTDEERAFLINFCMLPKRLYDAYLQLDVEKRKPDAKHLLTSIELAMNLRSHVLRNVYLQLPVRTDQNALGFLHYLKPDLWYSKEINELSPFIIEINRNYEVRVLKNERINARVVYDYGTEALKTYDKLLPLGRGDYSLIEYGLDYSWVAKVEENNRIHNVIVYIDDKTYEGEAVITYYEFYEDSGTPPADYNKVIEVSTEAKSDGNIIYTFTKNGNSVEVTYEVLDENGRDIADKYNVLQFAGKMMHKDIMNGVAQWQEG